MATGLGGQLSVAVCPTNCKVSRKPPVARPLLVLCVRLVPCRGVVWRGVGVVPGCVCVCVGSTRVMTPGHSRLVQSPPPNSMTHPARPPPSLHFLINHECNPPHTQLLSYTRAGH